MNNYRKQLAECIAREKVDRGDIFQKSSAANGGKATGRDQKKDDFMTRRMANYEMEADVERMESILKGTTDFSEDDYNSFSRR